MKKDSSVLVHKKTGDLAIIDFDVAIKGFEQTDDTIIITIDHTYLEIGKGKRKWTEGWTYLGEFT